MRDAFKTIVGGRSADNRPAGNSPRGIEILLKKASVDEDFAKVLLESPEEAARLISLDLQDSERRILLNTPRSSLRTMIRHTTVKRQQLSAFKTMSAALMLVAVVAVSSLAGASDCAPTPSKGMRADDDLGNCKVQMVTLQAAIESYYAEHSTFVSTADWYGPDNPVTEYLRTPITSDPWGNPYQYEGVEQNGRVVDYRLESYGPDGVDSEDDIECTKDSQNW
jgi:hypothetical protein